MYSLLQLPVVGLAGMRTERLRNEAVKLLSSIQSRENNTVVSPAATAPLSPTTEVRKNFKLKKNYLKNLKLRKEKNFFNDFEKINDKEL